MNVYTRVFQSSFKYIVKRGIGVTLPCTATFTRRLFEGRKRKYLLSGYGENKLGT